MSEQELRMEFHDILIGHTRTRIEDCHCGWGVNTGELGQSHALHVADHLLPVVRRAVDQARADERERIAWEIEQARPHVPPSHNQSRRERVVQRSTLTQAARIARGGDPDA